MNQQVVIDDDEERLVREVLAEDPPEERGERDEWAQHVGWHRKEDTHRDPLLRSQHSTVAEVEDEKELVTLEADIDIGSEDIPPFSGSATADVKASHTYAIKEGPKLRGANEMNIGGDLQQSTARIERPTKGFTIAVVTFVAFVALLLVRRRIPKRSKDML